MPVQRLRCDLGGGIAPAALTAGADGGHSEPVAGAARQAINRSARLGRGAVMCPARYRRRIGALLDHITLGARHGIPTEIDLPIMIPYRRFQTGGRIGHLRRARGRLRVHARAVNQRLVHAGHALNVTRDL